MIEVLRDGELAPVPTGTPGVLHERDHRLKHSIIVHLDHPKVQQLIRSPEVARLFDEMQAQIRALTSQPAVGPDTGAVMRGLGDGTPLGFAWLIPIIQGVLSMRGQGGGGAAAPASSGGFSDIIQSVMGMLTQTHGGTSLPGATPATASITMEQVNAAIQTALAQRAVQQQVQQQSQQMTASQQHGCRSGDIYSDKYHICYDPIFYHSEDEAWASMKPETAPTPQAVAAAQQQAVAQQAAAAGGGGRGGRRGHGKARGGKARGARKGGRHLRGTMINGVYIADGIDVTGDLEGLGQATPGTMFSTAAIALGSVAVGVGATLLAMRSLRRRRHFSGYRRRYY